MPQHTHSSEMDARVAGTELAPDVVYRARAVRTGAVGDGAGADATNAAGTDAATATASETATASDAATAVAVRDGKVLALGGEAEVQTWWDAGAKVVDLGSTVIVPGLIDSHIHPVMGAKFAVGVDLATCKDVADVASRIAEEAARTPAGEWVRGWGLDPTVFDGESPSGEALTRAVPDRPVFVRMFDAHSALVNQVALDAAQITEPIRYPSGGQVAAGSDGRPNGWLVEIDAIDLVMHAMPAEPLERDAERTLEVLRGMARSGLTGGVVMDMNENAEEILHEIERAADLPMWLHGNPWCVPDTDESDWAALASRIGNGGRRWQIAGIKFFLDGTIDNGTSWLASPDSQGESTHSAWTDPEQYSAALRYFSSRGIPTFTHAIGDEAVRHVAEAIVALPVAERKLHRIEHLEAVPLETVEFIGKHGLNVSMQPTHCTHFVRADRTDNWSRRLGDERVNWGWRLADMKRAGAVLSLGSDWPIAPHEPLHIMADARLGYRNDAPDEGAVLAEQTLDGDAVLDGYTRIAAESAGYSDRGVLRAGARADFTVLSGDPSAAAPEEVADIQVVGTVLEGSPVFPLVQESARR
ncbi:MAG: amidohydrolase [Gulosibacter sp.]|uniref:amidohydrolase n=1 Tax=Gulosibacter sp. TaxID=2817531 RepID=UPI003F90C501